MQVIDRQTAESMIRGSNGKLVRVTFVKRSDRRKMASTPYDRLPRRVLTGRTGVKHNLTGKGMAYDPKSQGLITLFEHVIDPSKITRDARGRFTSNGFAGGQYRHVPVEGIEEIVIGGKTFKVQ